MREATSSWYRYHDFTSDGTLPCVFCRMTRRAMHAAFNASNMQLTEESYSSADTRASAQNRSVCALTSLRQRHDSDCHLAITWTQLTVKLQQPAKTATLPTQVFDDGGFGSGCADGRPLSAGRRSPVESPCPAAGASGSGACTATASASAPPHGRQNHLGQLLLNHMRRWPLPCAFLPCIGPSMCATLHHRCAHREHGTPVQKGSARP